MSDEFIRPPHRFCCRDALNSVESFILYGVRPTPVSSQRRNHMNTLRFVSVATLLAVVSLAACTSNGNYATTNHQRHRAAAMDADTAARVKAAIQVDERITLRKTVSVNFTNGVAELLGEARNSEERALAQDAALRTPGVREVKNLITLR